MLIRTNPVFNVADAALSGGDPAPTPPVIEAVDPPSSVQPTEPVEPPPAADPPKQTPWFLKRIAEESAAKQAEKTAREAAERRAADAEAMIERLRTQPPTSQQPPIPTRTDDPKVRQAEINAAAAQQRLYEDSADVRNRGLAQFGEGFTQALGVLNAVGATNDEFVTDVLAVDKANAHVLLEKLAKEPEKAASLATMPSRQRIAELTRMSIATNTEKPAPAVGKGISKAPAPAPKIEPSASNVVDWRVDSTSDEDFDRGFREMMAKRARRR
jgi:hypothetical protein